MLKRSVKIMIGFVMVLSCLFLFGGPGKNVQAATIVTYPQPSGISASDKYLVKVSATPSFTYKTVAGGRIPGSTETASWTNFAFSGGSVVVEVTKICASSIGSVVVRPLDNGIVPTINGNKVTFTISQPCKLSVEFNGSLTDKCFIFADAPEVNPPSPSAANVLYYSPGVHDIGKDAALPVGKDTIYLAGGAFVRGSFKFDMSGRNNVKILGRGILSGQNIAHSDLDSMFKIYDSRSETFISNSITVDGITILDSFSFNIDLWNIQNTESNPNIINNVKEIGWAYNTDGFHSTGYLHVNDMFIFNSDDALDVGQFTKGAIIKNCVLWQNRSGASLLFSWVGSEETGNTIVDNIDVIHFNENELWDNNYVFMAKHGEAGHVNNITISNVRVEDFGGTNNRFLGLNLSKSAWSNPNTPYGNISNIHFKDIRLDEATSGNMISGFDATHKVFDIGFENLTIAGQVVKSLPEAGIVVNAYVSNVDFYQTNEITNGNFETNGAVQAPTGWSTTGTTGADYTLKTGFTTNKSYLGWHYGEHKYNASYIVDTYQTKTGLANGLYTVSAMVKSSGGQNASYLYASGYGSTEMRRNIPLTVNWTKIVIPDISVSNGQCRLGFYSDAAANLSLNFDNVILYRQENLSTPP